MSVIYIYIKSTKNFDLDPTSVGSHEQQLTCAGASSKRRTHSWKGRPSTLAEKNLVSLHGTQRLGSSWADYSWCTFIIIISCKSLHRRLQHELRLCAHFKTAGCYVLSALLEIRLLSSCFPSFHISTIPISYKCKFASNGNNTHSLMESVEKVKLSPDGIFKFCRARYSEAASEFSIYFFSFS